MLRKSPSDGSEETWSPEAASYCGQIWILQAERAGEESRQGAERNRLQRKRPVPQRNPGATQNSVPNPTQSHTKGLVLSSFYFHPSVASLYVFLTSNSFHGTDHLLYYTYTTTPYHTSAWHDHVHIHSALTQPLRPYSAHRHEGHTRTQARTRPLISYSFEHHTQRAALATHTHLWALRFVTWNVNGAGSREKKLKIFSQLKKYSRRCFITRDS